MEREFIAPCPPYIPIGHNFLLPEPFDPEASTPTWMKEKGETLDGVHYVREPATKSYVIPKRGQIPRCDSFVEELFVPTISLATRPRASMLEADRLPRLVPSMGKRGADSLRRQIDVEVFKMLNAAVPQDHHISLTGGICTLNLNLAATLIEEHDLRDIRYCMHPQRFKDLRAQQGDQDAYSPDKSLYILKPDEDPASQNEGIRAFYNEMPIYVSVMVPRNVVYASADPFYVGRMPVEKALTMSYFEEISTNPETGKETEYVGFVVDCKIGFSVINDYAVSRITVS